MRHDVSRAERRLRGAARAIRRLCAAIVACHAVAAVVPTLVSPAGAQISPGPLSAAHASLDGPLNCTKCHAGGKESMTPRCLTCHKEITWLTQQNRGYHARSAKNADCASCHPDHAGRDFALVKWPDGSAQRFDHRRAGWTLEGKHARLACEKCHTADLRVSPAATLGPKRSTAGWVGLETTCASCHEDVHKNSLGKTCESCHTAADWSPASRFDHAKSQYPLTGKHADVACEKCHVEPARRAAGDKKPVPQFKPLAHGDCVACHRDPHGGRLRGTCSSCHATTSFSSVEGRAFSHDRTRYSLRGKHASVSCVSCHTGYPARIDSPAFATCASCHSDPHKGQATVAGAAVDCAACHTVNGYSPSTFTVAQHARTAYPLEGRHATVACSSCHTRRPAGPRGQSEVVMRPKADRCESCHADAHGGQLAARAATGACATCHTPAGWKPSTFGVSQHATLRFALTGRHAAVECGSCHSAKRRGLPAFPATRMLGTANVALHLDETTCDGCHRDPHGGKYGAATAAPGSCTTCHDTRAFRPSTIDANAHAKFAFALDGAHRAAPCVACHTTMTKGASLGASLKLSPAPARPVLYSLPGATCATCHASPHGDQFGSRPDGGTCTSCHDLQAWSPASRFVHDANGGFALGAAHAKVPCASCHVARSGTTTRVWHGVPRACEACHRKESPVS